jgi:hypothetical protein
MINPLDLRPDLAEAISLHDNRTNQGLFCIVGKAFLDGNKKDVEAQLAFVMTMTLAVMPTIHTYWRDNAIGRPPTVYHIKYLETLKYQWLENRLCSNENLYESNLKPTGTRHQALDEAYLVLAECDEILHGRATSGRFESIIDDVTEGYAILPGHESIQEIRDWMFDEVIPYCAAGALPPFIYTIDGIKPTAAALKQLINHE